MEQNNLKKTYKNTNNPQSKIFLLDRKHIKASLLSILLLVTVNNLFAQTKKNSVYFEALGNGVVYSINYDRIIPISNNLKLAPRVGLEYIPRETPNKYGEFNFPIEINLLHNNNNKNPNFLESGLGLNLFSMLKYYELDIAGNVVGQKNKLAAVTSLRLGYRHQKPEGGLMYRAGILVKLTQDKFSKSQVGDDLFYRIWPGFGIGYTF